MRTKIGLGLQKGEQRKVIEKKITSLISSPQLSAFPEIFCSNC